MRQAPRLDAAGAVVGAARALAPLAGRHRAAQLAIDKTHALLELPADYRLAIVPGSDTGAFEMALWSMLGARGVDVLAWEDFGKRWVADIVGELKPRRYARAEADYGQPARSRQPSISTATWSSPGTARQSGVRVPDGDWIAADRRGLTFVDATSALFAQAVDWRKDRRRHLLLAEGARRAKRRTA